MFGNELIIDGKSYPYDLILSRRKTATIYVTADEKIIVKAPLGVASERIDAFICGKKRWIETQLADVKKYKQLPVQNRFVSGASLLYLGRQYKIIVQRVDDCEQIKLTKNKVFIFTKQSIQDDVHNGSLVKLWYDRQRKKIFKERFSAVRENFEDFKNPQLVVSKMKNRWGSYRVDGTIVLHPDLIKASKLCIDYVLFHEFCHHYHKRHDEKFYCLLSEKMPNWENVKEKLEMRFTEK